MPTDDLTLDLQDIEHVSDEPLVIALHVVKVGRYALQRGQPLPLVTTECVRWWAEHFEHIGGDNYLQAVAKIGSAIPDLLRHAQEVGS